MTAYLKKSDLMFWLSSLVLKFCFCNLPLYITTDTTPVHHIMHRKP